MTEQEFRNGAAQFFTKHPIGQELKRRWEHRIKEMGNKLVYESDPLEINRLQAKLQYHRDVLQPEIGI